MYLEGGKIVLLCRFFFANKIGKSFMEPWKGLRHAHRGGMG